MLVSDAKDALDRINRIHDHLTRAEVFRGYRPVPIALSGVIGLTAGLAQPVVLPDPDPAGWLRYWLVVGVVSGLAAWSGTMFRFLFREDDFGRRRTNRVVCQFLPCLLAGGAVTVALGRTRADGAGSVVALLPGLWAILFGLGVIASQPYLPRRTGWVAWWYLGAGALLLSATPMPLTGWPVGVTFGCGQVLTAITLAIPESTGEEDESW